MSSHFVEVSTKESAALNVCKTVRTNMLKQLMQWALSRAYVEMSNDLRKDWDPTSKRDVSMLSWLSIHEVDALRALRLLPGAIRATRSILRKQYADLLKNGDGR